MVTGAGGSIGSELARQVARFKPAQLLLVERAEIALFEIDQELRRSFPQLALVPLVADVGEEARIRRIFDAYRPHVVLHAAAHKHVPMMEANPAEAIKNNILGTGTLGELAAAERRRGLRDDLDRQGRQPDVGHGRHEAGRGARCSGAGQAPVDALRRGPLRQRHRIGRLRSCRSSGSRFAAVAR